MHPLSLEAELLQRCTFPDDEHVFCAVSGGADSLALMLLAVASDKRVTAIHVDHGLRDGSQKEAEFVAQIAAQHGAEMQAKTVEINAGPNLEARARSARYAVLPNNVLTGHTADDQAETVLLNLLRGAGLSGLSGMRSVNKPLLSLRRRETEAVCKAHNIIPFMDPTNGDPVFRRNRVRNELLPLLNDIAQRDVADVLARQTVLLRDDDNLLNALASDLDPTDAKALAGASPALARRALRMWLAEHVDDEHHPPSAASVDRVLAVARGEATACEIENGVTIRRSAQRLLLVNGLL